MMNDEHDINIVNSEVKTFLTERCQNQIQFCPSERANESIFVFSSSINLQYVAQKLRSLSMTKTAPEKLRKDFLSVNFNLNHTFCDGNDLSYSWQSLPISDGLLAFFHPFSTSVQQNCILTTQNILIHIEQTLKLKMTITEVLMVVTKILQPVVVLLL